MSRPELKIFNDTFTLGHPVHVRYLQAIFALDS